MTDAAGDDRVSKITLDFIVSTYLPVACRVKGRSRYCDCSNVYEYSTGQSRDQD